MGDAVVIKTEVKERKDVDDKMLVHIIGKRRA